MAPFPRADQAFVERAKLYDYILCPDHPEGCHKARVFSEQLGIRRRNWQYLRDRLLSGLQDATDAEIKLRPYATFAEVDIAIEGLNGETRKVKTVWESTPLDPRTPPRDRFRNEEEASMTVENTVVELAIPVGDWPVGTIGTVVSMMPKGVLIEIADEDGCTLDLIATPDDGYRVVKAADGHDTQEFAAR